MIKGFVLEHILSSVQRSVQEEEIINGIRRLFMAMIKECCGKDYIKTMTTRDAESGETLQNWTTNPSLVRQES